MFTYLCCTSTLVNHNKKFPGKKWPEAFFYVVRSQGYHFIAEIIVNRIIGNNYIYTDRYGMKIFPDL